MTLNILELLVSVVSIYITIQQLGHRFHVLAFTDSSSAIGCIHKASFDPVNYERHDTFARWMGWKLVRNEASREHHWRLTLKGLKYFRLVPHKKIQLHSTSSDSGIIPHQTTTQRYYLLGIITSRILDMTKGISKDNTTKQSGNWERWRTFLTHTGITDKLLDGIPQVEKTILVLSFASSVQSNQFGATCKPKILHITVKSAILGVSTSFWTHLWGNLTLDVSGQRSLIIIW